MTILFESEELTLGYANQIVISKLSLCVNHPSNVEIIGNNGSGKSTLISCISGNFTGNSFNSIIKKSENSVLEIGSSRTVIESLTLLENIMYFTNSIKLQENSIDDLLTTYQLNEFKNDYVRNFSSGMVRRAELLIAELKSPDLLCIDEPYLFLDSNGLDLLSNLLRRRTNSKKTNILSSQMNTDLFDEVNLEVNLNVK
jgi:ABC-type multidrug transport system ATPase subunit